MTGKAKAMIFGENAFRIVGRIGNDEVEELYFSCKRLHIVLSSELETRGEGRSSEILFGIKKRIRFYFPRFNGGFWETLGKHQSNYARSRPYIEETRRLGQGMTEGPSSEEKGIRPDTLRYSLLGDLEALEEEG